MPNEYLARYVGNWLANTPWAIPWRSGRFYPPGIWPLVLTTTTLQAQLYAIPTIIPNGITLASMQLEVTTGVAGAGRLWLGIYDSDEHGWMSDAIYRSSTISIPGSGTGLFGTTGLAVVINPGLYWVVAAYDGAGFMSVRALSRSAGIGGTSLNTSGTTNCSPALIHGLNAVDIAILATVGLPSRMEPVYRTIDSSTANWIGGAGGYPRVMLGVT